MNAGTLLALILAVMFFIGAIAHWCWPEHGHSRWCKCRICIQRDPRPGGTL